MTPPSITDRLLRISEVGQMVSLSTSQIYQLVREGDFPRPLKVGASSRWRESDIGRWIDAKAQASA